MFRLLIAFLLLGLELGSTERTAEANSAPSDIRFPVRTISIGTKTMSVEIASTANQRKRGLMYRPHMDQDKGMIFLMPKIGAVSFWMKDTLIPLSLAYLNANGEIVEMENKKPFDTRITHTHSEEIAYVLEVNEDWFARNNIGIGTSIRPAPNTWKVVTTP